MPRRSIKPTPLDDQQATTDDTRHYFDSAHGDVAALHARIERGFADYSLGASPHSPVADRFEQVIQQISRSAGIVSLAAALTGIAYYLL
ncbi:hypothetical protein LWE61_20055 [Sphingobium sufflavum]|uniref:hypothetical protein n=1 Tax=Sphingobium sufflavum TaxID=1129547 RepID=UPI001F43916F|nr:hypothetical protein [Sphingobium sufflavum]MCE7798826.1 hypothetical protein [Sphingobium sufflavum]